MIPAGAFFTYLSNHRDFSHRMCSIVSFAAIAVRLIRQEHQANGAAVAANRLIHAVALNREMSRSCRPPRRGSSRIGVLDLVREHERRHLQVGVFRFPEGAALALEPERRQRPLYAPLSAIPALNRSAVRQQVRRHERSITMAADADAIGIDHAHFSALSMAAFASATICST